MIEIEKVRRYRRIGLDVEAIRFLPQNHKEVANWCKGKPIMITRGEHENEQIIVIKTMDGEMIAHPGDYIIKINDNSFYPCNAETFTATYEEIENGTQ